MKTLARSFLALAISVSAFTSLAAAEDIILTAPGYDHINAYALDQPELNAVLTDGGAVISENDEPVMIEMFIDTGSSSFVISHLNAEGYDYEPIPGLGFARVPSLGLDGIPSGEFIGSFTETGIAGQETGDVTKPLGVKIFNGPVGAAGPGDIGDFVDYGLHSLWVRRDAGIGEIIEYEGVMTLVDPINVAGMPVISQRVMVMDPTPMADLGRLETRLLEPGDLSIPQTNATLDCYLADLTGPPDAGEVLPSTSDNPIVRHITIAHDGGGGTLSVAGNEWLFDTGAGSTLLSFAKAQAVGLIDPSYENIEDYLVDHIAAGGITGELGGIGAGTVVAPVLQMDEISIATEEGFNLVWQDVAVLISDINVPLPGGDVTLEGVLGMNLLLPSVTVDPADPLGFLDDISPGYFDAIVFDATNPDNVELRLYCDLVPEPACLTLLVLAVAALRPGRKRRG